MVAYRDVNSHPFSRSCVLVEEFFWNDDRPLLDNYSHQGTYCTLASLEQIGASVSTREKMIKERRKINVDIIIEARELT